MILKKKQSLDSLKRVHLKILLQNISRKRKMDICSSLLCDIWAEESVPKMGFFYIPVRVCQQFLNI